jgi:hypothetical protein
MNKTSHIWILFAVLLTMALSSCIFEEGTMDCGKDSSYVRISLVLKTETRTETWQDYDPKGGDEAYDFAVNPSSINVLLVDSSTVYKVDEIVFTSTGSNTITFVGTLPSGLESKEYSIVVTANESMTDAELQTAYGKVFTINTSETKNRNIPMFGLVKKNLTIENGYTNDIGNIYLLRATAKVAINMSTEMQNSGYSFSSVTVHNVRTQGHLSTSASAWPEETLNLDISTINDYTSGQVEDITVSDTSSNLTYSYLSDDTVIFYIPEYANSTKTGDDSTYIDVTIEGTDINGNVTEYEYPKALAFNLDGERQDIVRNHFYKFTVSNIFAGHLVGNLNVLPWDMVTQTVEYSNSVVIDEYLTWGEVDGNSWTTSNVDTTDLTASFTKENDNSEIMKVSFKISKPDGATWYAVLDQDNAGVFVFTDESGNILDTSASWQQSGAVGDTEATLYIKFNGTVSTTEDYTANLKFALRLSNNTTVLLNNLVDDSGIDKYYTIVQPANVQPTNVQPAND